MQAEALVRELIAAAIEIRIVDAENRYVSSSYEEQQAAENRIKEALPRLYRAVDALRDGALNHFLDEWTVKVGIAEPVPASEAVALHMRLHDS